MQDTSVARNIASGGGGGIRLSNGDLRLLRATVTDNVSGWYGGGLYGSGWGAESIRLSDFSGNEAYRGGGVAVGMDFPSPLLEDTTFTANAASNDGGGVFILSSNGGGVQLTDAVFDGNLDQSLCLSTDWPVEDGAACRNYEDGEPVTEFCDEYVSDAPQCR